MLLFQCFIRYRTIKTGTVSIMNELSYPTSVFSLAFGVFGDQRYYTGELAAVSVIDI